MEITKIAKHKHIYVHLAIVGGKTYKNNTCPHVHVDMGGVEIRKFVSLWRCDNENSKKELKQK